MVKVVVADDEMLLRSGLRVMLDLEPDIEVVAEAADGAEAVDLTLRHHPDVVLMDVRMPHVDGLEAIRRLQAANSRARILVITTFDVDEYVHDSLSAGASGFLLKHASPEHLADAVRRTARGEIVMDPAVTVRLVKLFMGRPTAERALRDRLGGLTDRELDVLRLLARGCSNAEIAAELHLSEATIKTHVTKLLGKLDLRSRLQAVVLAYETGLVRPGAADG
jgi:DNA-binding NarL/FixJ family response regulator